MDTVTKRSRVKVTSPFAEVRTAPVSVHGSQVSNQAIEIRDDHGDWQCLNIHSSSYKLVPNALVNEIAEEILIQTGQQWTPQREVWTGRYWAKLYRSNLDLDVPEVGDTISLGIRVENSYDGSCQFRIVLMGFVLSCTNGLVSPKHFSSFTMKTDQFSMIAKAEDEMTVTVHWIDERHDTLSVTLAETIDDDWGVIGPIDLNTGSSGWSNRDTVKFWLEFSIAGHSTSQDIRIGWIKLTE